MKHRIHAWSVSMLDRFNVWFTSDGGVWQTLLITIVIVLVEHRWPHLDPNGFLLLYWLTVYSAITQPALARAGRVSGDRQEMLLAKIEGLEETVAALLETLKVSEDEALAILRARQPHRHHHRKETVDDR